MTYEEYKKLNPNMTEKEFEIAVKTSKDLISDIKNKFEELTKLKVEASENLTELKQLVLDILPKVDLAIEIKPEIIEYDEAVEKRKQADLLVEQIKNNFKELHHVGIVEKESLQDFKTVIENAKLFLEVNE